VTKVIRGMPFRAAACSGALYHIELYVICGDLPHLGAGVYQYGAHDNALRQLRKGDFRFNDAPLTIVLTSTWWRNAWKYQSRAYRHAFWDAGTVLANLLSIAEGQHQPARVCVGFADQEVNALLGLNPEEEAAIALVSIGELDTQMRSMPEVEPLHLPTRRLSARQVDYPLIVQAHAESSLPSWDAVARWRAQFPDQPRQSWTVPAVEEVILRRGSSRGFTLDPITGDQLQTLIDAATSPTPMDAFVACDLYLVVNAVDGLPSGTYVVDRNARQPLLLRQGDFRRDARYLDLGQDLAGEAALNIYWLVDLNQLDDRGYRAAQLSAAIEAGKVYLAAYAQNLGATGLTFFDDDVTSFFSPDAAGKSVMFLTAVGRPARRIT
jgi:SagB-type dehydrogenase family enzyme